MSFAIAILTIVYFKAVALPWLLAALSLPFICVSALRIASLVMAKMTSTNAPENEPPRDTVLPTYTILVPLYREAAVVPDLMNALARIDYPAGKLEIFLIVEAGDRDTKRAVMAGIRARQSAYLLTVPKGSPRTKPRALNFALSHASGDFVVVYDAEDQPEPSQLRRAVDMFHRLPCLACVQAGLNIYNARETWLTRQFAIEYTALFDGLLPTLEAIGMPIPLGGTSNHFRRSALEAAGAWDPFNVTEDADLGIRLARLGFEVRMLPSTTWEEAPPSLRDWFGQRTRWLKGWLQTYLVHMRSPLTTLRDLGFARFIGLQVLMGGLLLSAYVHPWIYVLAAREWLVSSENAQLTRLDQVLFWIGVANMLVGYAAGIGLGYRSMLRRGERRLAMHALWMPFYWLLISLAAYRALLQFATAPFHWEKTTHRRHAEIRMDSPATYPPKPSDASST
ncbi:MAG: glycosyltransferase [Hyphomicrobium sp.]